MLLVTQFCVWPFYRCLGLQEGREGEREGERYEGKWNVTVTLGIIVECRAN